MNGRGSFWKTNWFAFLVVSPFAGSILYAWMDARPPLKIISASVRSQPILQGGNMIIEYEAERTRDCGGVIERQILDRQEVMTNVEPYEFTPRSDSKMGRQKLIIAVPVPVAAAPGGAKYRSLIRYYCNAAQRFWGLPVLIETPSVDFTIAASDGQVILPPVLIPGIPPETPGTGPSPILNFNNRKRTDMPRTELGNIVAVVAVEERR